MCFIAAQCTDDITDTSFKSYASGAPLLRQAYRYPFNFHFLLTCGVSTTYLSIHKNIIKYSWYHEHKKKINSPLSPAQEFTFKSCVV